MHHTAVLRRTFSCHVFAMVLFTAICGPSHMIHANRFSTTAATPARWYVAQACTKSSQPNICHQQRAIGKLFQRVYQRTPPRLCIDTDDTDDDDDGGDNNRGERLRKREEEREIKRANKRRKLGKKPLEVDKSGGHEGRVKKHANRRRLEVLLSCAWHTRETTHIFHQCTGCRHHKKLR